MFYNTQMAQNMLGRGEIQYSLSAHENASLAQMHHSATLITWPNKKLCRTHRFDENPGNIHAYTHKILAVFPKPFSV